MIASIFVAVLCCTRLGVHGQQVAVVDNRGNDFILSFLRNAPSFIADPSNTIFTELHMVPASSDAGNITVDIEYPVGNHLQLAELMPGEIIVVSLPTEVSSAWLEASTTVKSNSVRVSSVNTQDFVVYMVNRSPGTSGAALALPVDALNNKYIVAAYRANIAQEFVVTAAFDDTRVTITPTSSLVSSGGQGAFVPFAVSLNRGESFFAVGANDRQDFTGSTVQATRPVTMTNGNQCTAVPNGISACDHIFEVALPVQAWGMNIAAAPLPQRDGGTIYRIVASTDNTSVSLNSGSVQLDIPLSSGGFFETERLPDAVFIQSNTPIFVAQFMTGIEDAFAIDGDPSMGNMIATNQYLNEYTFSTVPLGGATDQLTDHYLSVIANIADIDTFILEGAGTPDGIGNFSRIGDSEWAWAAFRINEGTHTSKSMVRGHGITIAGYNFRESYHYTGGAKYSVINQAGDLSPPDCFVTMTTENEVLGSAAESAALDSGIFSLTLLQSTPHLKLDVIGGVNSSTPFLPGDKVVNFTVTQVDSNVDGIGSVLVTDGAGLTCAVDVALILNSAVPSAVPSDVPVLAPTTDAPVVSAPTTAAPATTGVPTESPSPPPTDAPVPDSTTAPMAAPSPVPTTDSPVIPLTTPAPVVTITVAPTESPSTVAPITSSTMAPTESPETIAPTTAVPVPTDNGDDDDDGGGDKPSDKGGGKGGRGGKGNMMGAKMLTSKKKSSGENGSMMHKTTKSEDDRRVLRGKTVDRSVRGE